MMEGKATPISTQNSVHNLGEKAMTATQRIHPAKPLTPPPQEPTVSTNDHTSHVTVHKDPYVRPSWIVSYGNIHIGSAHSIQVAHTAAYVAAYYSRIINPPNCHASYLIDNVKQALAARGYREYWTPATPCAEEHLAPAIAA